MSGIPLTPEELAIWEALEEASGVDSLVGFVPLTTPWYQQPEHLRPLADIFYRADRDGKVRALSSTPPQHAKTESMLHWIIWYLRRNPTHNVAYVSYEAGIAAKKSRACREIAERAGIALDPNTRAAAYWRTKEGGGVLATGIGGPLTGFRVDLLVIDDPHKNRIEAESVTFQERALDWARSVAFTRLTPRASVIVNMARWSDGDLIGRLSAPENEVAWEQVNLEAIANEGRSEERALCEALKPLEWLKEQRRLLGPYDWASLYCGSPQPRGGALFKDPAFFRYFADIAGARLAIGCDPAATAKTSADYSTIVVVGAVGEGIDQKVYVLDVWRGQVEIPQLVAKLREYQDNWRCPVYVEAQGGFKAVPQMLRQVGASGKEQDEALRVVEVNARSDKFIRALPVSAAWNDGRVLLPFDDEPWKAPFLREVKKFTGKGDKTDDQVDALSHAFTAVDRRANPVKRSVATARHK